MSYNLSREKQVAVVSALIEGSSIRSTERMTGVHRDTVTRLLVRVGDGCAALLDQRMRNLSSTRIELDELWSFVGKKQRNVRDADDADRIGDAWVYVALDSDTKIIPSFLVGKRTTENTNHFVADVASRLRNRVQLSTDGLRAYLEAVERAFGEEVDYATIVKSYEAEATGPGRYSPPKVTGTEKTPICGAPIASLVSTSYVERVNLSIRMSMRRFTRLTNGFSKKMENHVAACALNFAAYNFVKVHRTLRATPAMAAGVEPTLWNVDTLVGEALARAA